MMPPSTLWDALAAAGLVREAQPPPLPSANPWYVTAMVGAAAWVAALFLLAFFGLALASVFARDLPAIAIGVVVCGGAIAVLRAARGGMFVQQLAVAASLAGQALVAFGIVDDGPRNTPAWLAVAAFETLLVVAAPEATHRVIATLAASIALRVALTWTGLAQVFPALLLVAIVAIHAASEREPWREALWAPILAGLGLAMLCLVPFAFFDSVLWYGDRPEMNVVSSRIAAGLLIGVAWIATVGVVAREAGVTARSRDATTIALGALAIAACAWPIPYVVVALGLLLVAFAGGRVALTGLAVLVLLVALGHTYYALAWTLLAKAAALAVAGGVLLAAGAVVRSIGGRDA